MVLPMFFWYYVLAHNAVDGCACQPPPAGRHTQIKMLSAAVHTHPNQCDGCMPHAEHPAGLIDILRIPYSFWPIPISSVLRQSSLLLLS
jgi:hypothetical protein